jgi:S1-C subfamily serine protease
MLRKAMPAVVSIAAVTLAPAEDNPLYKDPYYRRFFGEETPQERPALSAGSGVVIDAERGLVLTNNHVIRNAERISVTLADGRRIDARRVGGDSATDIAVLAVTARGLVRLPRGNSNELETGDDAVAIGNPFGLGQTVTTGIVSALGPSGLGIEGYEEFIQTDAVVNPGNAGGALVASVARLVGINTAIVGASGGNIGIGFAIPVNMARDVADQLARFGTIANHPTDMLEATQASTRPGAMITDLTPGSAADKAGLKCGDLIVAINSRPIVNAAQLRTRVGLVRIGRAIELELLRNDGRKKVTARVAEPAAG